MARSHGFLVTSFCIALSISISACTIRPVPVDMGIVPPNMGEMTATAAIVQRIRCEARYAIAKVAMGYIRNDLIAFEREARTSEEISIINKIKYRGPFSFDGLVLNYYHKGRTGPDGNYREGKFDDRLLNISARSGNISLGDELTIVQAFANSGVGYQFDFEITENNDLSGGALKFQLPFNMGKFDLGFGAEQKLTRKNKRVFTLVERIQDIVFDQELIDMGCNEIDFRRSANAMYPIYGSIDLIDSFSTYAALVVDVRLGVDRIDGFGEDDKAGLGKFSSQDLQDEITFTTERSASATPEITLNPIPNNFRLVSGTVGASGKRVDVHKLTLILQQKDAVDILQKLELERLRARDDGVVAVIAQ